MSDYKWRDKVDPHAFTGKPEEGFKHYRAEWERLMNILTSDSAPKDRNEREAMRSDARHASARMIGFSYYVVP